MLKEGKKYVPPKVMTYIYIYTYTHIHTYTHTHTHIYVVHLKSRETILVMYTGI